MRFALVLLFAVPLFGQTVSIFHFSDYHSHAQPFYTEEGERGGIARALRFLQEQKRHGALVFSGGDSMNKGAPSWSDKFTCAEWPWWNGIVDAMALGNHDADYGFDAFQQCAKSARYPILAANVPGLAPYKVFTRNGIRIGVFAVAGRDFRDLVKVPGFTFNDPVAAARETVRQLRDVEHVDAVVLIGHEHTEDDYALAREITGIDLILGTHSHLKRELVQIPGTRTWFISPSQYLTYISWVELHFAGGKLGAIDGALLPVDARMKEDRAIAKRIANMQHALESDPQYRELFEPIGSLDAPLSAEALARRALEVMRRAAHTDIAISTTSSFRGALPSGTITMELLRAAMPYDNEIVVCTMTGAQLQQLARESFVAGEIRDGEQNVATTDYVMSRDKLPCQKTGVRVRAELRKSL